MRWCKLLAFATALLIGCKVSIADTHTVSGSLGAKPDTKAQKLAYFSLMTSGDLLSVDEQGSVLRVITADDKLKTKIPVPFPPHAAIAISNDAIVVSGPEKIALLDMTGKVNASAKVPAGAFSKRSPGLAVTDQYIFVTASGGTGFSVWRFDRKLEQGKELAKGLRGCCGIQDIATDGKFLYIAENAKHHVIKCDFDGTVVSEFGKYDPDKLEGFGGCCEPKNIFVTANGTYTSESDNCRIKLYTADGKCTLVGFGAMNEGCLQVCVAASSDGSSVYFLDSNANVIRVLKKYR